ncbi:MAG TPA: ABC transporter ATP-binding protein [Alphaproteobacteria bacterium]|nr:ABC transporter ATP-binding protein [Alphaproteobacteria bacterium]
MPVVKIAGLRIGLAGSAFDIVDEIDFQIGQAEIVGLVGESGSGKTTVGLALLGFCRRGGTIEAGHITIAGRSLLELGTAALNAARGQTVAYIPQDPSAALNPALRIGLQLEEMLAVHQPGLDDAERRKRVLEMLEEVKLPTQEPFLKRYKHQLSGGQQQRVALAMAFACRPTVIVLDEPTTGLDVTTQAHVLETVRTLCRHYGVAALYVSHDLAVVASLADRVLVMYAGRIVESGPAAVLFRNPAHPYTRRLIAAIPDLHRRRNLVGIPGHAPSPAQRPLGCTFAPRCDYATGECRAQFPSVEIIAAHHSVRCWHHARVQARGDALSGSVGGAASRASADPTSPLLAVRDLSAWYGRQPVLHKVSLTLEAGECMAVAGESGSGKTTLAQCVAGLHPTFSGEVMLAGKVLEPQARRRPRSVRRAIQYVFQSPYASLNPRRTVGQIVARPLYVFFDVGHRQARERVAAHLERVALSPALIDRYPDQLSGGERQRVALARALAADPQVLVCDEVTSALDVSVQAALVELLAELQRSMNLGLLFITHNLALIRTIADRVAVMSGGRIVESAEVESVFGSPKADYTRELLANSPSLDSHAPISQSV